MIGDLFSSRWHRMLLRASVGALVGLSVVACGRSSSAAGGEVRSRDAFCEVWLTEGKAMRDRYVTDAQDPLANIVNMLGVSGDLAGLYRHLAEVAPAEIRTDVEVVADAFQLLAENQAKVLSDPFGTIGQNTVQALSSAGAQGRVDDYIVTRCGLPPSASVAAAPTSSLPLPPGSPFIDDLIDCNDGESKFEVRGEVDVLIVIDLAFPGDIEMKATSAAGATSVSAVISPLRTKGPWRFATTFPAGMWTISLDSGMPSGGLMTPMCDASVKVYPT